MTYDIVIIGAGPGGYEAALHAAKHGLKVALIEKDKIGGTCLNYGCIPTKALIASASAYRAAAELADYGFEPMARPAVSLSKLMARKDKVVDTNRKGLESQLKKAGVEIIAGTANIIDKNNIAVSGFRFPVSDERSTINDQRSTMNDQQIISAKNIIIATGTQPMDVGWIKIDHDKVISSDDLLSASVLPVSLAILGGGVMGCEFAFLLNALGVQVTVIEAEPRILPMEDEEISELVCREMKKVKIKCLAATKLESYEAAGNGLALRVTSGEVRTDKLLISIGRRPVTTGIGLEAVGLSTDTKGYIEVGDQLQTRVVGVYAVGDINGKMMVAHVAAEQGRVAVDYILGKPRTIDYSQVPMAIFTMPEIGRVGLTEQAARKQTADVVVKKYLYRGLGKAHAEGAIAGLFKLVADSSGRLLGAHIMGAHASDIIMEAVMAMRAGLTIEQIRHVVHAHPTYVEGVALAAMD